MQLPNLLLLTLSILQTLNLLALRMDVEDLGFTDVTHDIQRAHAEKDAATVSLRKTQLSETVLEEDETGLAGKMNDLSLDGPLKAFSNGKLPEFSKQTKPSAKKSAPPVSGHRGSAAARGSARGAARHRENSSVRDLGLLTDGGEGDTGQAAVDLFVKEVKPDFLWPEIDVAIRRRCAANPDDGVFQKGGRQRSLRPGMANQGRDRGVSCTIRTGDSEEQGQGKGKEEDVESHKSNESKEGSTATDSNPAPNYAKSFEQNPFVKSARAHSRSAQGSTRNFSSRTNSGGYTSDGSTVTTASTSSNGDNTPTILAKKEKNFLRSTKHSIRETKLMPEQIDQVKAEFRAAGQYVSMDFDEKCLLPGYIYPEGVVNRYRQAEEYLLERFNQPERGSAVGSSPDLMNFQTRSVERVERYEWVMSELKDYEVTGGLLGGMLTSERKTYKALHPMFAYFRTKLAMYELYQYAQRHFVQIPELRVLAEELTLSQSETGFSKEDSKPDWEQMIMSMVKKIETGNTSGGNIGLQGLQSESSEGGKLGAAKGELLVQQKKLEEAQQMVQKIRADTEKAKQLVESTKTVLAEAESASKEFGPKSATAEAVTQVEVQQAAAAAAPSRSVWQSLGFAADSDVAAKQKITENVLTVLKEERQKALHMCVRSVWQMKDFREKSRRGQNRTTFEKLIHDFIWDWILRDRFLADLISKKKDVSGWGGGRSVGERAKMWEASSRK